MHTPSTTNPVFQLFYSARSPFARRVRLQFQKLLIPFEAKEINVFEPTEEFLKLTPLATVPVLKITTGKDIQVLADSSTILEYLHENHGGRIWPSTDLELRTKIRSASTFAVGLMTNAVNLHLEKIRPQPSAEIKAEYELNIRNTLAWISKTNLAGSPWKLSDFQMTQAGYDLCIALEYLELRASELNWKGDFSEVARFLDLHRKRQDLSPTAPPAL